MDCAFPISLLSHIRPYKPGRDAFHRVPNLSELGDALEGVLTLSERRFLGLNYSLHARGSDEPCAGVSPSPLLEERDGERRPLLVAAIHSDIPADRCTSGSGVPTEINGLLSLALSSKGGEGNADAA